MDNYTPNPFITQPIYDPTRPFATPRYEESGLILLSREVLMMTTRLQVHSYSCHVSEIKEKKG